MTSKEKPKYKQGDKVCADCAKVIDKKNQYLPWFSEQLRAKDRWVEELLQQIKSLQETCDTCQKCGCNEFLCGCNKRD